MEDDLVCPDEDAEEFAVAMTAALKKTACEKGDDTTSTSIDGTSSKKTLNRHQRRTIHHLTLGHCWKSLLERPNCQPMLADDRLVGMFYLYKMFFMVWTC